MPRSGTALLQGLVFCARCGRRLMVRYGESAAYVCEPLRDRAVIGTLLYTFAQVGAATALRVEDYFLQRKRWWLRLHEKSGKYHEMLVHHCLEEYLDAYIAAAGITDNRKGPLFRTAYRKTGQLTGRPMRQEEGFGMIR